MWKQLYRKHTQYNEHLTQENSNVFQHNKKCNIPNFSINILNKDQNPTKLRIKEAYLIKSRKPSLNCKEECANSLLY